MVSCQPMTEQQRLSAATEAWRRLRAVELHQAGWTGRAIAEALGVVPSAVSSWLRKAREGGVDALRARRQQTGKRPKLTAMQQQRLLALLTAGAEAHGAIGERWTGKRVAALIKREFGVAYHPEYIPRLLRSLGWTPQQPVTKASQRDEQQIAQFKAEWETVKKGRKRRDGPSSG
jgi:transposase